MSKKMSCLNQKGFTLIELISVMIIMGVVASVSIQKFDIVSETASEQALQLAVKELNIRESLTWSQMKISADGYTTDEELYELVDKNLDGKYLWTSGPNRTAGGTLQFQSKSLTLSRQESTPIGAGRWQP